jgi:hypothetical protein
MNKLFKKIAKWFRSLFGKKKTAFDNLKPTANPKKKVEEWTQIQLKAKFKELGVCFCNEYTPYWPNKKCPKFEGDEKDAKAYTAWLDEQEFCCSKCKNFAKLKQVKEGQTIIQNIKLGNIRII